MKNELAQNRMTGTRVLNNRKQEKSGWNNGGDDGESREVRRREKIILAH